MKWDEAIASACQQNAPFPVVAVRGADVMHITHSIMQTYPTGYSLTKFRDGERYLQEHPQVDGLDEDAVNSLLDLADANGNDWQLYEEATI